MNLAQYTKEFSYNIRLAYPVILGMLGHTITGIVDNIMVGKLGAAELAAASLGNSMVFVAMSVGIGFSTAITPIIAEGDAEKDTAKVRTVFHHGLFLCTVLGLLLFAVTGDYNETTFLWSPGIGYANDVIDLSLRYEGMSDFNADQIAIRLAYGFKL